MDDIEKRAISDLQAIVDRWDADPFAAMGYDASQERRVIRECLALVKRLANLTPPEGHVVVTRNEAGQAVAVTRQDDEGRILSVIAEFEHHPSVPVATLAALADRWASDRNYTGSPVDDIRALIDEPTDARPEVP